MTFYNKKNIHPTEKHKKTDISLTGFLDLNFDVSLYNVDINNKAKLYNICSVGINLSMIT